MLRACGSYPQCPGFNSLHRHHRAFVKAGLNKSINDAGWFKFLTIPAYKAKEQGKKVTGVPACYTSQRCSACGGIVKKSLSVRTHRCSCGFVANRYHNAALNILRIGMDMLQACLPADGLRPAKSSS